MASKGYLFVNKHSDSPSLSRNTGSEASLASKVNKHVQQQRFPQWKQTAPRQNWYRPFVRAESSTSSGSTIETENSSSTAEYEKHRHGRKVRLLPKSKSISGSPPATSPKWIERTVDDYSEDEDLSVVPQKTEFTNLPEVAQQPDFNSFLTSEFVTEYDPFNSTAEALTPETLNILYQHLAWASSSSVTDYAVRQGKRRLFSTILQDEMHSAAFLAHATSQLRKYRGVTLDPRHSPEVYIYKATKLLRKHIAESGKVTDPYALVDVFRLCLTEWINGNYVGARAHLGFIAQKWAVYRQKTAADGHNIEVISCADIFLAVDTDTKPILSLTWEPEIETSSTVPSTKARNPTDKPIKVEPIDPLDPPSTPNRDLILLLTSLSITDNLAAPIRKLLSDLARLPSSSASKTDFSASTSGPLWNFKRRMQANLHRILCIRDQPFTPLEQSLRRVTIILLTIGTTSAERRAARVDMARLTRRLQSTLEQVYISEDTEDESSIYNDPGFWLWMYATGLASAMEEPVDESLRGWFLDKCVSLVEGCGRQAPRTIEPYEVMLERYLYLRPVHRVSLAAMIKAL